MNRDDPRLLVQALILLAVLVCYFQTAMAQEMATEQALRAAMVFNILKFAEFPPEDGGKNPGIRLCVAVRDVRQMEALAALSGRKIGRRELIVTELTAQRGDCEVLYLDSRRRWMAATEHPGLRRALTISDYPGFARDGGMIEIDLRNEGVRFDINLAEARRAGFRFAPQMLRLARQIYE